MKLLSILLLSASVLAAKDIQLADLVVAPDSCGACDLKLKWWHTAETTIFEPKQLFALACHEVDNKSHLAFENSAGLFMIGRFNEDFDGIDNAYFGTYHLAKKTGFSNWNGLARADFWTQYEMVHEDEEFSMFDKEAHVSFDESSVQFSGLAVGGVHKLWTKDPRFTCWATKGMVAFDTTSFETFSKLASFEVQLHSCYSQNEVDMFEDLQNRGYVDSNQAGLD